MIILFCTANDAYRVWSLRSLQSAPQLTVYEYRWGNKRMSAEFTRRWQGGSRCLVFYERQDTAKCEGLHRKRETSLCFRLAEKVLLHHLFRQPGKVLFLAGLKPKISGSFFSNFQKCKVSYVPEEYWTFLMTENEVASMISHSVNIAEAKLPGSFIWTSEIYAKDFGVRTRTSMFCRISCGGLLWG